MRQLVSNDAAALPVKKPWCGDDGAGLLVPEGKCASWWLGFDDADTQGRGVGIWAVWGWVFHGKLVNRGVVGKGLGAGGVFGDDVVCFRDNNRHVHIERGTDGFEVTDGE